MCKLFVCKNAPVLVYCGDYGVVKSLCRCWSELDGDFLGNESLSENACSSGVKYIQLRNTGLVATSYNHGSFQ